MWDWSWVVPAFLRNVNFAVVAPGTEPALWSIVDSDWSPLSAHMVLQQMAE
jgi:hypothetical protein